MDPFRKIIHCDCDCFFAAIEMRDAPELRLRPIAVGGDPARRGVIATCNYEARRFGVRSAMPSSQALTRCPSLLILPPRMAVYREVSQRILALFRDYTELVEPLSLDEAYLDVSASRACQGSATRIAEEIRQRVRDEVGITLSAGVAPNKFLAKVSSDWNKPDGLWVVRPEVVESFVAALPVERLPGVGPATLSRLQALGVARCEQLRQVDQVQLVQAFGRFGNRLHQLCRGVDDRPVRVTRRRKSLGVEHTYAEDLSDLPACLARLPGLLEELARRLEKLDGSYRVSGLLLKMKFSNFVQTTVEQAGTAPSLALSEALCRDAYARGGRPVRLLGLAVRLQDSGGGNLAQLSLFGPEA